MNKIDEFVKFIQSIEISTIIDIIISIVLIILVIIFSPVISYGISKIFHWKQKKERIKSGIMYNALKNFLILTGIYIATLILNLNEEINLYIYKIYRIALIWVIAKTVSDVYSQGKLFTSKLKEKSNDPMINIVNKFVKIVLYIAAGYLTFKEFGYDLGVLFTGLGLSTAIIALAAQDTIRDLFAGFSIFFDRPFAIGDWVEIGTAPDVVSGTVEDISFRSTKIKTIEDTMITVQNSNISTKNITNWSVIGKRVYRFNLKLPLETEEVIVEKLMNRIKFILKYNKDIRKDSINVTFNSFQLDGINIYIYLETDILNYVDYQKFCNKINLTILNILETQNVRLAYPSQNVYVKNIDGINSVENLKKHAKATKIEKDFTK